MPPPPQRWKARDYRLRTIKSIQTHPNASNIIIKVIYVLIPSMPVMACHSLLSLCLCRSFSSSTTTPDARKGRGCCGVLYPVLMYPTSCTVSILYFVVDPPEWIIPTFARLRGDAHYPTLGGGYAPLLVGRMDGWMDGGNGNSKGGES